MIFLIKIDTKKCTGTLANATTPMWKKVPTKCHMVYLMVYLMNGIQFNLVVKAQEKRTNFIHAQM